MGWYRFTSSLYGTDTTMIDHFIQSFDPFKQVHLGKGLTCSSTSILVNCVLASLSCFSKLCTLS